MLALLIAGGAAYGGFLVYRDATKEEPPAWMQPAPMPGKVERHTPGGVVRVAVSTPPEMADTGVGGRTLRQLTLPQLFSVQPDGTWRASLVEPGTDRVARDGKSATFRFREGAAWSDGTPITVDDLQRTMDDRFVSGVEQVGPDITVRFTQRFPGWRQLWSGDEAIRPAGADTYGGAFVVSALTSGLETTLTPNTAWYGDDPLPFLSEVHLVYVPDTVMQRQLLAAGQLDVVVPVADTVRTEQYRGIPGVEVEAGKLSGQWTMLVANPANLLPTARRAMFAAFPRREFTGSLLQNEASVVEGLLPNDTTWTTLPSDPGTTLSGINPTFSVAAEDPFANLLTRSLQRAIEARGGTMQSRITDAAAVSNLVSANTFDIAFESAQDGPDPCWLCRWASVDEPLARAADSGDNAAVLRLEQKLRDEAIVLPLWRPVPITAARSDVVGGVTPNGYVAGVAWNAERWFKP